MNGAADLDRRYLWHPFTQMRDWNAGEPVVIVEGEGTILRDEQGREYLDGNSSIWTNLHGHRRPEIDRAIKEQLGRIAHSSFLGLANDVAPRLARELMEWLRLEGKVFLSDDGSTAIEADLSSARPARRDAAPRVHFAFGRLPWRHGGGYERRKEPSLSPRLQPAAF